VHRGGGKDHEIFSQHARGKEDDGGGSRVKKEENKQTRGEGFILIGRGERGGQGIWRWEGKNSFS